MNLRPHPRTQAYYNELAQLWRKGAIYYNPKTQRTTYINLEQDVTSIFKGKLPSTAIKNGQFNTNEFGDALEIKRIITNSNPTTKKTTITIAKRKPDGNVYQYLSKFNCIIKKIEL